MSQNNIKPVSFAIGAAFIGSLAIASTGFAMADLGTGYQLATASVASIGEGKCGEGKCGMDAMDTNKDGNVSSAEHASHAAAKFAAADTDKNGMVSKAEMDAAKAAHHEGKCGEGKCGEGKKAAEGACGGDKKAAEGKCGEGKCGEKK